MKQLKWLRLSKYKTETIKLQEENIGSTLFDIHLIYICLYIFLLSSQTRKTRAKIIKCDYVKLKSFLARIFSRKTKKREYLLDEEKILHMIYLLR